MAGWSGCFQLLSKAGKSAAAQFAFDTWQCPGVRLLRNAGFTKKLAFVIAAVCWKRAGPPGRLPADLTERSYGKRAAQQSWFETTDPEQALAMLAAAYTDNQLQLDGSAFPACASP